MGRSENGGRCMEPRVKRLDPETWSPSSFPIRLAFRGNSDAAVHS